MDASLESVLFGIENITHGVDPPCIVVPVVVNVPDQLLRTNRVDTTISRVAGVGWLLESAFCKFSQQNAYMGNFWL